MALARGPCLITRLLILRVRPLGTLQILKVIQRLLPALVMIRWMRIGYLVSFLKLIVCFVLPTIHTVASRPAGYLVMYSLWALRASGTIPASSAALNNV